MGITNRQGNPSQEWCTWSLSKQSTVQLPALLQTLLGMEPFPGFGLLLSDTIMPPAQAVSVPCTEKVPVVLRGQRVLPLSVGVWPPLVFSLLWQCKLVRMEGVSCWLSFEKLLLEHCLCCTPVSGWANRCTGACGDHVEPDIMIKNFLWILKYYTCI